MGDFFNINTFWGVVFAGVITGIILLWIQSLKKYLLMSKKYVSISAGRKYFYILKHLLNKVIRSIKIIIKEQHKRIKNYFMIHWPKIYCLIHMTLASLLVFGVNFDGTTYSKLIKINVLTSDMFLGINKSIFEEETYLSFVNITEKFQVAKDALLKDAQLSDNSFDIYEYVPKAHGPNGTMPRGTNPQNIHISDDMKNILKYIKQIIIGCNKDWVDEKLGPPYATEINEVSSTPDESDTSIEFLKCVYLYDIVSVTIFFDTMTNSCEAYYITLMDDIVSVDVTTPKAYSFLVGDKPLGDFTFSEINGMPSSVYGFSSNGNGRAFYGEEHYFASRGNYHNFFFAVLDYGMLNSYVSFSNYLGDIQLGLLVPEKGGYNVPEWLIEARKDFYPNTFGISSWKGSKTFDLLSSYTTFDSAVLRKER